MRAGGEPGFTCKRGPRCAEEYQARLSGPFLDRIDIHLEVPAVSAADLVLPAPVEGSAEVAARVAAARALQRERYAALGRPDIATNAEATARCSMRWPAPTRPVRHFCGTRRTPCASPPVAITAC